MEIVGPGSDPMKNQIWGGNEVPRMGRGMVVSSCLFVFAAILSSLTLSLSVCPYRSISAELFGLLFRIMPSHFLSQAKWKI